MAARLSRPSGITSGATMKGAAVQLFDEYQGVGSGTSLASKIQQAQADLAADNVNGACGTLGAFIHEVRAQSGKHIPAGQASQFIADAQQIVAVLAC